MAKRPPSPKPSHASGPPRHILMISSEMAPFARTGGLGEVLGSLPPALGRAGLAVTVALPRYGWIEVGAEIDRFALDVGGYVRDVRILEHAIAPRVRALFVDCPDLYARDGVYGRGEEAYPDNPRRFAWLTRAALEHFARTAQRPAVVHAHDWHAGLAPVYLKTRYRRHPVLGGVPTVLTIHNLAYQGVAPADWLPRLDLGSDLFTVDRLEFWGQISFLKGGVVFSDVITTVSPTYAREIQQPESGVGFDGILRQRAGDLVGILNGIDVGWWNPARDPHLPAPYSADDPGPKIASKREALNAFDLPADEPYLSRPLVGMITRLVPQKGFDLLASVGDRLAAMEATFVLLGSGDRWLEEEWQRLAARHPDRVRVRIGFDDRLAHLIEGGADLFLMPSRFEPCGLNQLYSLRYGTVPVVRATGGLADTVTPYDPRTGQGTGFVFREYTGDALLAALAQALDLFRNARRWRRLQRQGMAEDHSWDASARQYVQVYDRVIRKTSRRGRSSGAAEAGPGAGNGRGDRGDRKDS